MDIIKLTDHAGNSDPAAVNVTTGRGPSVYKTARGFVVCLPSGLAVDGFFPDRNAALAAQVHALDDMRRRPAP
jgi:hypothetical protein